MQQILKLLANKSGTDFSNYKPSTVYRRMEKRLVANNLSNEELQSANEEVQVAYSELRLANEMLEKKDLLLQESTANLKALLDNTLQAFFLIDRNYKIISFNRAASKIAWEFLGREIKQGDLIIDNELISNSLKHAFTAISRKLHSLQRVDECGSRL